MDEPHNHADFMSSAPLIPEHLQAYVEMNFNNLIISNLINVLQHGPFPFIQERLPDFRLHNAPVECITSDRSRLPDFWLPGPFIQERLPDFRSRDARVEYFITSGRYLTASDPFRAKHLQGFAEKFKKNGFVFTVALAEELQWAAKTFLRQRSEFQKTLRLSEERKKYEAIRDSLAQLIQQFSNWHDPSSRSQFVFRIPDHYWQAEELDESFHGLFAMLRQRVSNWNDPSSCLHYLDQILDLSRQTGKEFDNDYSLLARLKLPLALYFALMLETAEQLFQALHRLFTDVLSRLPEDEGGRRKDLPLHSFILQLKKVWEEGTGKKAGRSRNPRTREIEGPFVRFVRTCLTYLEPDKPYPSLEETIHKVLQDKTITRNGKNLPKK